MPVDLADGLYAVVEPSWVAGFVVCGGRVTDCAPILRARLGWAVARARGPIRESVPGTFLMEERHG